MHESASLSIQISISRHPLKQRGIQSKECEMRQRCINSTEGVALRKQSEALRVLRLQLALAQSQPFCCASFDRVVAGCLCSLQAKGFVANEMQFTHCFATRRCLLLARLTLQISFQPCIVVT